jgi:hypothetical protein
MENQELHAQKVTILSRLIKENYLTLEEALLLLKDEEKETKPTTIGTSSGYGTLTINPPFGTWNTANTTTGTYVAPPSFISTSGSSTITNIAGDSADLNN